MTPYYASDDVQLFHGDCREVLPTFDVRPDCVIADPPYGETSLTWDRWPDGWPTVVAAVTNSMWCFGSMRMFLDRRNEFDAWKLSQDVVWEKHNGPGFALDRLRRVHELVTHWYRGPWSQIHHDVPRVPRQGPKVNGVRAAANRFAHAGDIAVKSYEDDGTRLVRSVIPARSAHGRATHPTEKPLGILAPLLEYACPPGGLVLDPFAGSGSTAVAARLSGRRALLVEADERYCERIAQRLQQDVLPLVGGAA